MSNFLAIVFGLPIGTALSWLAVVGTMAAVEHVQERRKRRRLERRAAQLRGILNVL
jgi:acyl-CoA hydrolase